MASDLSSGCTEVNELFDDEKEEGEISLDDVSSSEEGQPYKYPPRVFQDRCLYCQSTQRCASWCSLILYKNHFKKDVGLQGKENRVNPYFKKGTELFLSSATEVVNKPNLNNLQKKKKADNVVNTEAAAKGACDDLVPISSDSDMELVGLSHDTPKKKRHQRDANGLKKPKRRKRRKKSSTLSLSLSPPAVDIALLVKESIHNIEPKDSGRSRPLLRRHSSERRKLSPRKHNHSPVSNRLRATTRRRARSPMLPPPRKNSPLKQRKPSSLLSPTLDSNDEMMLESPASRGNVTKLLKKVRQLEPFSSKAKEKGSSLKDKLSGIIKLDKKESMNENSENVQEKKFEENLPKETRVVKENFQNESIIIEENKEKVEEQAKSITKKSLQDEIEVLQENKENKSNGNPIVPSQNTLEVSQRDDTVSNPKKIEIKPCEDIEIIESNRQSAVSPVASLISHLPSPASSPPPSSPTSLLPVSPLPSPSNKLPNFCMDDNEEDLELRMIALRSAVLKKHRTRMQCRGEVKKKKQAESPIPQLESPFTPKFLEDYPQLAEICRPSSPLSLKNEIYCTEDMELDSDLELDKAMSEIENSTSPYSPTSPLPFENALSAITPSTPQQTLANLSLYSPSNPTETPVFKSLHNCPSIAACHRELSKETGTLDSSMDLLLGSQETRPYSPTDATVYDPELPGVLSDDQINKSNVAPPLQPPPLPPLSILASDDSLMLSCPTNLMTTFVEPMPIAPPPLPPASLLNGFSPTVHQPMLLPTPLFRYAAQTKMAPTSITNISAPVSSESVSVCSINTSVNNITTATCSLSSSLNNVNIAPSVRLPACDVNIPPTNCVPSLISNSVNSPINKVSVDSVNIGVAALESNKIDDFGETDLDGSPLVPMEKSVPNVPWSYYGKPFYQHDASSIVQENINKISMTKPSLFFSHNGMIEGSFKPVEPIDSSRSNSFFKPIMLQTVTKNNAPMQPAAAFNKTIFNSESKELEKATNKDNRIESPPFRSPESRKHKRKRKHSSQRSLKEIKRKEMTPLRETRKRSESVRSTKEKSSKSSKENENHKTNKVESNKKDEATQKKSINDEIKKNDSLEEDEETLREILLASLAKRLKKPIESLKSSENGKTLKKPLESGTDTKLVDSKVESPQVVSNSDSVDKLNQIKKPQVADQCNENVISTSALVSKPETIAKTVTNTTTLTPTTLTAITKALVTKKSVENPGMAQLLCKEVKKVNTIPASTKVVNNAKRFKNLIIQRKIIQQKLIAASKSRFKLNNAQIVRSESPLVTKLADDTQKFIINLNEDSESEAEADEAKSGPVKSRPTLAIPVSDFEKSVDQFLKNVRQEQEAKETSIAESNCAQSNKEDKLSARNTPIDSNTNTDSLSLQKSDSIGVVTNPITTVISSTTNVNPAVTSTKINGSAAVTGSSNTISTATNTTTDKALSAALLTTSSSSTMTTVASTDATVSILNLKNKKLITPPKTATIRLRTPSFITTPQAVKHLSVSQQEEYRRLKQQIIERERLKLQKSKEAVANTVSIFTAKTLQTTPIEIESAAIPTTTVSVASVNSKKQSIVEATESLAVPTSVVVTTFVNTNPVTVSVSESLPVTASVAVAATGHENVEEIAVSEPPADAAVTNTVTEAVEVSESLANPPPIAVADAVIEATTALTLDKKDVTATSISSEDSITTSSVLNNLSENKPTSSKLNDTISDTQCNIPPSTSTLPANKDLPVVPTSKLIKSGSNQDKANANKNKPTPVSKIVKTSKVITQPTNSLSIQSLALLDKMNDALKNQQKKISAVAHKVSSLRILTKDQVNAKCFQAQKPKLNVETLVNVNDSNKSSTNIQELNKSEVAELNNIGGKTNIEQKQKKLLAEAEEKLISKRQLVVNDISEMSENLRQWEIEKDIQSSLTTEIKQLREQLRIAERKLQQQNGKLSKIQPKLQIYHGKINDGRKECLRLAQECSKIGQEIAGPSYKVPTAGAELLNSKLKDVADHSQKIRNKKSKSNQTTKTTVIKTENNSDLNESNLVKSGLNSEQSRISNTILKTNPNLKNQFDTRNVTNINLNIVNIADEIENDQINAIQNQNSIAINDAPNLNSINAVSNSENNCDKNINNSFNNNSDNVVSNQHNFKSISINQDLILNSESVDKNVVNEKPIINFMTKDVTTDCSAVIDKSNQNSLTEKSSTTIETNSQTSDFNIEPSSSNGTSEQIINNFTPESISKNLNTSSANNDKSNSENLLIKEKGCYPQVARIRVKSDKVLLKQNFINKSLQRNILLNQSEQLSNAGRHNTIGANLPKNFNSMKQKTTVKDLKLRKKSCVNIVKNSNINVDQPKEIPVNNSDKNVPKNQFTEVASEKSSELTLSTQNNSKKTDNNLLSNTNKKTVYELNSCTLGQKLILQTETYTFGKEENRTNDISSNTDKTTFLEEVSLLERASAIDIPDKITTNISESSKKRKRSTNILKQDMGSEPLQRNQDFKKKALQPYESILKHLYGPRNNMTDGVLCPYELSGTCNDEDCQYVHLSTSHCR